MGFSTIEKCKHNGCEYIIQLFRGTFNNKTYGSGKSFSIISLLSQTTFNKVTELI